MQAFRISIKRPIEFLTSVLEAFSSDEDAKVSFEGDLQMLQKVGLASVSLDETTCLRRHILEPMQDFLVIPLSRHNLQVLVSLFGRVGVRTRVVHVQIESRGGLVFAAYDQFDSEGAWISTRFSEGQLLRLHGQKVIGSYELVRDFEQNSNASRAPVE
jgi:hypothetical protein